MVFYKLIGLFFYIPSEILSWFFGKKYMNNLIKGDLLEIDSFVTDFPISFTAPIIITIMLANEFYYSE